MLPGNHSGVVLTINARELHSYLTSWWLPRQRWQASLSLTLLANEHRDFTLPSSSSSSSSSDTSPPLHGLLKPWSPTVEGHYIHCRSFFPDIIALLLLAEQTLTCLCYGQIKPVNAFSVACRPTSMTHCGFPWSKRTWDQDNRRSVCWEDLTQACKRETHLSPMSLYLCYLFISVTGRTLLTVGKDPTGWMWSDMYPVQCAQANTRGRCCTLFIFPTHPGSATPVTILPFSSVLWCLKEQSSCLLSDTSCHTPIYF